MDNKKFNLKIDFSELSTERFFSLADIDVVLYLSVVHQTNKENPKLVEINTQVPTAIAIECQKQNIHFIYMSTEQVFESQDNFTYKEDSPQNAKTKYGISKGMTEKALVLMNLGKNTTILRSSMIYGYKNDKKKNVFNHIDWSSIAPYSIYSDAYTKPTFIDDLCECIDHVIENKIIGVFHTVGNEMIDRVSLLKMAFINKYSKEAVEYFIKPVKTPSSSDIQKYINIECSPEFKRFFKITLKEGVMKQLFREFK